MVEREVVARAAAKVVATAMSANVLERRKEVGARRDSEVSNGEPVLLRPRRQSAWRALQPSKKKGRCFGAAVFPRNKEFSVSEESKFGPPLGKRA